ncbi:hypothetical protein A2774_01140 [Candidatus Roizmanbacteria bacterium RIFCSPHIGHO2_01_FULL_39_12c]|uniref:Pentapeptide repeat protein n=1 Tax=Candidatus Roizmanbacteria bacterium RIFCSPHIGHO2_01_FULL_39_12c TaxID=1802031 RepID=A0A1F7G7V7_9BACT|nr:MAG: hypothetical protein A2774_01140 [Candidatus Roizmanbacteria bacterium RIFCSPHIGHO2_01_FULL_39_12c]OGK46434.1 MAG: hypothetical protein A2963_01545 [Candidatus Roizmanbacteria bacterium RIFCSPLOWO2_01_FULL_40_13]
MPLLVQAHQGGPPSAPPGGGGVPLPFICTKCDLYQEFHTEITQGNYINAVLWRSEFNDMDISGSNFSSAKVASSDMVNVNASGANFTGADLRLTGFHSDTNLQNANFTNANLKSAEFDQGTDLTGVIWSNTTCPDGTNSDNNGNTCEGHLSP